VTARDSVKGGARWIDADASRISTKPQGEADQRLARGRRHRHEAAKANSTHDAVQAVGEGQEVGLSDGDARVRLFPLQDATVGSEPPQSHEKADFQPTITGDANLPPLPLGRHAADQKRMIDCNRLE
jgi:hypothetical protein